MNLDSALDSLRIAAEAWGVPISPAQAHLFRLYLELLLEKGAVTNLTAETDPRVMLMRHVADGLAAVPALRNLLRQEAPKIAEVGAGGGFIGIAVKIAWPHAEVSLIESAKRKYDFLNLAAVKLGLRGLRVVRHRIGSEPAGRLEGAFDAVVERALAPLPLALRQCVPLAAPDGCFVAYQSQEPEPAEPALRRALDLASARLVKSVPYRLPEEDKERYLAVFARDSSRARR